MYYALGFFCCCRINLTCSIISIKANTYSNLCRVVSILLMRFYERIYSFAYIVLEIFVQIVGHCITSFSKGTGDNKRHYHACETYFQHRIFVYGDGMFISIIACMFFVLLKLLKLSKTLRCMLI